MAKYFFSNVYCSGMTCSENCFERAWNDVESDLQNLSIWFKNPLRDVEVSVESLKQVKIHAHILSSNIFRHSLLFYVNPYTKRDWTIIVATWTTIYDRLEQLETILVNKKGKILQDALWFHIQDLVKKLKALWLKKVTRIQLNEATFLPKSGGAGANATTSTRKRTAATCNDAPATKKAKKNQGTAPEPAPQASAKRKSPKHTVKEFDSKQRNPLKLKVKIPKRPKLQRQHGVIENRGAKYTLLTNYYNHPEVIS